MADRERDNWVYTDQKGPRAAITCRTLLAVKKEKKACGMIELLLITIGCVPWIL